MTWTVFTLCFVGFVAWMWHLTFWLKDLECDSHLMRRRIRELEGESSLNKRDPIEEMKAYDQRIALADYLGIEWAPTKMQAGKWIRKEKKK